MNTCIKKFDAAQKGVEQAERGYMISQKRYDTGAGTWLEMNDAELALTQARVELQPTYLRLYGSEGRSWTKYGITNRMI